MEKENKETISKVFGYILSYPVLVIIVGIFVVFFFTNLHNTTEGNEFTMSMVSSAVMMFLALTLILFHIKDKYEQEARYARRAKDENEARWKAEGERWKAEGEKWKEEAKKWDAYMAQIQVDREQRQLEHKERMKQMDDIHKENMKRLDAKEEQYRKEREENKALNINSTK